MFIADKELSRQLDNWLNLADLTHGPARAIIAPYVVDINSYFGCCLIKNCCSENAILIIFNYNAI